MPVFTSSIWKGGVLKGIRGHLAFWVKVQEIGHTQLWERLWGYGMKCWTKWKSIALEVPWEVSKVYRNYKLLNATFLWGNVKSQVCMLVGLQPKQTRAHRLWQKEPTWRADNRMTRFFSTDMAPSHKIYEQNCLNTVTAFVNMQHSWKQRILKHRNIFCI